MKKLIAVLLAVLLLCSAAPAEDFNFKSMTEMDQLQEKLDAGITIEKVYYTDGYGFSTSEFSTDDPEEIQQLWTALNKITVVERVDESITDWYPLIVFYPSDGTRAGVRFEAHWLSIGNENYELANDDEFWALTAALVQKHEEMERDAEPGGQYKPFDDSWIAAGDPAVTDEIRALFDKALDGLVGVNYIPVAYLGSQVVAGYNHAILCQATTVYPGAAPRWVIMYLYEDLNGGVTITDITDLNW